MFPELQNALNFEHGGVSNTDFIGISQDAANGTFVIHHILSYFLKIGRPVCFFGLSQSFNHYNSVAQKMGTNLKAKRDSKQLLYIEGLKLIGSDVLSASQDDEPVICSLLGKGSDWSMHKIYELIKHECSNFFPKKHDLVIIFDDLSTFINIGFSVKEVINFVGHLNSYCYNNGAGSLVTMVNSGASSGDEDAGQLWKFICHSCTTRIEICGLSTGYCKDVHGEVVICV